MACLQKKVTLQTYPIFSPYSLNNGQIVFSFHFCLFKYRIGVGFCCIFALQTAYFPDGTPLPPKNTMCFSDLPALAFSQQPCEQEQGLSIFRCWNSADGEGCRRSITLVFVKFTALLTAVCFKMQEEE